MKELKGIEEFHPAEADLPQPLAWKGKPKSFRAGPGGNSGRKKQGCHYYCRNWPYGHCRVQFCDMLTGSWHYFLQTEHYDKNYQAYATCISPYHDEKKQYIYSNYPK